MTPTEPLATLVKASEFAKPFISELSQSIPLLLSSLAAAIFLSIAPACFVPTYISSLRGLFVTLCIFLLTYFAALWWFARRPQRQGLWQLKHIGEDERMVLRSYLKQNKTVGYHSIMHGPVCSLIAKGILRYASNMTTYSGVPVFIQPYAMIYLRKHPALVGLKPEEIGSERPSDGSLPSKQLQT